MSCLPWVVAREILFGTRKIAGGEAKIHVADNGKGLLPALPYGRLI